MNVSLMEAYLCMKTESGLFGREMQGCISHFDFLESKCVGFDEIAPEVDEVRTAYEHWIATLH